MVTSNLPSGAETGSPFAYFGNAANPSGDSPEVGQVFSLSLTSSDPTVTGIQLSRTQTAQDTSGFGIGNAYLSTTPGNGWQLPFNGNGFLSLQYTAITTTVPEPESYDLFLVGFGLIAGTAKRRAGQ